MPYNDFTAALAAISTPQQGARVLWAAVIYQAVLDATEQEPSLNPRQRQRRRESAIEFLTSSHYRERCELLGIRAVVPPAVVKAMEARKRCGTF